jgi:NADPH-dependent 2,4-dienoyl-CoA reductase/sulfur reductase-like enzyme
LRAPDELAALDVDLRLGRSAVSLDVEGRRVLLDDGSAVGYDDVVVATGAAPRRLPGPALEGVHVLRTVDDCLALRTTLGSTQNVVVVGAGFIGLEVAASARAHGRSVTVIDVLPAPLARVLPPDVGAAVQRLHEDNGVDVRCGVGVTAISGRTAVESVALDDGTVLPADVVVVGIGVVPETGWLADSGLRLDDGVLCDESLRAAPGVWAVGDVARWTRSDGSMLRVEHWTNATEQPLAVACDIVAGTATPFASVPYFWSDQYDAKLQSLGFPTAGDELHVAWGGLDEPKWVGLLHSGDRLTGVIGMRAPARLMKLRPLLASGASYSDALASFQ